MYLPILHLPRVELRCKLREELHRMTEDLNIFTVDVKTEVSRSCKSGNLKSIEFVYFVSLPNDRKIHLIYFLYLLV